jgi:predicted MFS family arabinose efflux permease
MSVFTSQAAVLVLSPILVMIATDLDVSTAVAGQLRIVAAPLAALVAVLSRGSAARSRCERSSSPVPALSLPARS